MPNVDSMRTAVGEDIRKALQDTAQEVDAALSNRLRGLHAVPASLTEAMRYSLEAGGKRMRPALVLWTCELCDGRRSDALPAAMAVECVHTFSLIHDDLPAIDNDDIRRGKPTCHKRFGEAMAILAGDALLALAFEILSNDVPDAALSRAMVRELSTASGGLIGGEAADIEGESCLPELHRVAAIHAAKTARLIEASCRLGGLAARASETRISALAEYGRHLGLAFQATDDLLDATGDSAIMGKPVQRDQTSGKQTYVRAVGVEESRRLARREAEAAVAALDVFGDGASILTQLAWYVVERES